MTEIEIAERIEKIKANIDDDEVAHGLQNMLYLDFIKYIASLECKASSGQLRKKALQVLEVEHLDFVRWKA